CIECGACAFVCPSKIPLVKYYRQEKAEIQAIDQEAVRTAKAKARYESKLGRLEREKLAREERYQKAAIKLTNDDQKIVHAALERVRSKKSEATATMVHVQQPDNPEMTTARERFAQQETEASASEDPRKAAVAAAIVRAKAKKAKREASISETHAEYPDESVLP
ncbi:MAG: electron transport complex subunit RsxC, partial [Serratia symbiotica]|nr:electron transport complex subunit RsxC [Serratia symbiotica]